MIQGGYNIEDIVKQHNWGNCDGVCAYEPRMIKWFDVEWLMTLDIYKVVNDYAMMWLYVICTMYHKFRNYEKLYDVKEPCRIKINYAKAENLLL